MVHGFYLGMFNFFSRYTDLYSLMVFTSCDDTSSFWENFPGCESLFLGHLFVVMNCVSSSIGRRQFLTTGRRRRNIEQSREIAIEGRGLSAPGSPWRVFWKVPHDSLHSRCYGLKRQPYCNEIPSKQKWSCSNSCWCYWILNIFLQHMNWGSGYKKLVQLNHPFSYLWFCCSGHQYHIK